MAGRRISRWKRMEVAKLMQMAGWSIRQGGEGHMLLQKGSETINLGSDPVHKNSIAEVQRALGVHISTVIRKKQGKVSSKRQIKKRLELAQQMDAAGFTSAVIMKQTRIGSFYAYGFRMQMLREGNLDQRAQEIHENLMKKRGIKIRKKPVEEAPPKKPAAGGDDVGALLELMASIDSKLDDRSAAAQRLAGIASEKVRAAASAIRTIRHHLGKAVEVADSAIQELEAR